MAVSLGPVSDPGAEMTLLEINQELQSQLEQSKQDFRDLKQKFLVSESTAYILANQLQKYSTELRVSLWNRLTCFSQHPLCTESDPASLLA
uniref:Neuroblastoma breakpoint family member 5 n=1 Tax=Equus asinus TaxID=9793 RepID=A0A8C4LJF2_EQUAS